MKRGKNRGRSSRKRGRTTRRYISPDAEMAAVDGTVAESAGTLRTTQVPLTLLYQENTWTPISVLLLSPWLEDVSDEVLENVRMVCGERLSRLILKDCTAWNDHRSSRSLFARSSALLYIDISNCPGATDGILGVISRSCGMLETLKISYCQNVTGAGLIAFAQTKGGAAHSLTHLDCEGCSLATRNDGARMALSAIVKGMPSMKSINLRACRNVSRGSLAAAFAENHGALAVKRAEPIVRLQGLLSVDLSNMEEKALSDEDVSVILSERRKLEILRLDNLGHITDDAVRSLSQIRASWGMRHHGGFPSLRILSLARCAQITDVSLSYVAASCPSVEEIDCSHCKRITDWGLRALNGSAHLQALSLRWMN